MQSVHRPVCFSAFRPSDPARVAVEQAARRDAIRAVAKNLFQLFGDRWRAGRQLHSVQVD